MSNQTVGTVYQQIIREVVESSRVDFEEGGVDESVLDELTRLWQQKLSQLNVATFPWDPKPEPAAPTTTLTSIPPMQQSMTYPQQTHTPPMQQSMDAHQVHQQQQQQQYMQHASSQPQAPQLPQMPQMPQLNGGVRIKTEPGLESGAAPAYAGLSTATTAQQRAAQNLQASYGARAAASINAIHHGMPQQGLQQQQGQPQRPLTQGIPRPPMSQSQYTHAMAQQTAQQRQQMQAQGQGQGQGQGGQGQQNQGQNGAQHAQTDGADDGEDRHAHFGVIKQIATDGAEVSMGRVEIDGLIRRQMEARGKAMEGGGLMLPLKQHSASTLGRDRRRKTPGQASAGQHDGADEDDDDDDDKKLEDEDEDAINSALDDSDEPKSDDSGDEETPQVMLCMYDKVQRVKNKWKCVMKDGVLTINGKDYVFHKASGEYEW